MMKHTMAMKHNYEQKL